MSGPQTLLIVDDNEAVRSTLGAYMSRIGSWASVLLAENAGRALELASSYLPMAIVLDNAMPGLDGIDVLPDLRRICPEARIVVHTTDDNSGLRELAAARGANAVVLKGRPLTELVGVLAAA